MELYLDGIMGLLKPIAEGINLACWVFVISGTVVPLAWGMAVGAYGAFALLPFKLDAKVIDDYKDFFKNAAKLIFKFYWICFAIVVGAYLLSGIIAQDKLAESYQFLGGLFLMGWGSGLTLGVGAGFVVFYIIGLYFCYLIKFKKVPITKSLKTFEQDMNKYLNMFISEHPELFNNPQIQQLPYKEQKSFTKLVIGNLLYNLPIPYSIYYNNIYNKKNKEELTPRDIKTFPLTWAQHYAFYLNSYMFKPKDLVNPNKLKLILEDYLTTNNITPPPIPNCLLEKNIKEDTEFILSNNKENTDHSTVFFTIFFTHLKVYYDEIYTKFKSTYKMVYYDDEITPNSKKRKIAYRILIDHEMFQLIKSVFPYFNDWKNEDILFLIRTNHIECTLRS